MLSLTDPQRNSRVLAARALGQLGEASAVPVLAEGTRSPDPEVRASAIQELGHLGPLASSGVPEAEPAIPDLIAALDSRSWIVRSHAAELLGEIGPAAAEATAGLIKLLSDSALEFDEFFWDWVRYSAAEALGKLGAGAVPHLIEALDSPRLPVRIAAAEALGEIGAPAKSAIPRLQDLQKDEFITLRHSAAEALHKIRQSLPPRE